MNEIENDWWFTSFDTLIVTDWDITNWEGEPEMTPFDESRDNPIGSDPDEIENEGLSPLIEGVIENDSFLVRTYDDWEYENDEIGVRIVNKIENDRQLTSFDALIVTDWDITDREGVPDMIPFVGLRVSPAGRDPDDIENEGSNPLIIGITEKESSTERT